MASTYDFTVTRGSEFEVRLLLKDENGYAINLPGGYNVRGVVKHRYSDTTAKLDLSPAIQSGSDSRYYDWVRVNNTILLWADQPNPLQYLDGVGESYYYSSSGTNVSGVIYPHIDIKLTASQTASLPIMQGVYDVEIYDTGTYATKPIKGFFNVLPEVTTQHG